jgi:PAS domain S-box-containing protein
MATVAIVDHEPAKQAVYASEQDSVRAILDELPVKLAIAASDGRIEHLNRAARDALGVSVEKLRELGWQSAVPPFQSKTVADRWRSGVESGEPFSGEYQYLCADGKYLWWRMDAQPVRDRAGTLVRWYVALTDISTPGSFAFEAPPAGGAADHYREILDVVPAILWCAGTDGKLIYTNRATRDYSGVTAEQLAKENFVFIHPDDVPHVSATWWHSLATGEPYRVESRMRAVDGTYKWSQVRANPAHDEQGRIKGWFGCTIDIDDLKTAQAALRQSEERLRLIVNTIPIAVWAAGPDGKLTFNSDHVCRYFGMTAHDGSDWNRTLSVHPDDLDYVSRTWANSVATGEPYRAQIRLRRADGVYRWFDSRADPLRDEHGHVTGWYGANIDIDDRKRLEAEAREARRRFEQAARIATVAELSASIAHEIKQPLTAIVGNGHACQMWLSTDPPNSERARLLAERIIRDGMAAADIVERIRSLFKRAVPTMAVLDVNGVIKDMLEMLKDSAGKEGISVKAELATPLRPVRADRVQIQQVLSNLAQNAVDAMAEVVGRPRELVFRSRSSDDHVVLVEVCDSGCGLESPERVFESFFTTKPNGMGMGLAICRSIIEAHGGKLRASANPTHGTTFSFTLPAPSIDHV